MGIFRDYIASQNMKEWVGKRISVESKDVLTRAYQPIYLGYVKEVMLELPQPTLFQEHMEGPITVIKYGGTIRVFPKFRSVDWVDGDPDSLIVREINKEGF